MIASQMTKTLPIDISHLCDTSIATISVPPEEPLLLITIPKKVPKAKPPTTQATIGSSINEVSRIGISQYQKVRQITPQIVRTEKRQPKTFAAMRSKIALIEKELSQTGIAPLY